ncbi:hypothetical protein G4177_06195 [Corallococcus sp. ZKHCc1 1396]|uniref:Uncharacterized protein n=1 Tax=Corallococcus soli TaxID=2710757 RepID=A0ABR9PIK0_9BACT|nr:hypothetical protein [Corallococcus soli]MBE4747768.1 hypothetical protein [Corallococcus soli]
MTCIAAVAHRGRVVIGGDSAGVGGYELSVRRDPKVFRNGPFVIGFTTSFRMGQLLEHAFTPPPVPTRRGALERYLVVDFVDALRGVLTERGWARKQNGQEEGGTFLVGVSGRLFRIDSDYQVGEARDGFDAVGCGSEAARGALFASSGLKPDARVRLALRAAERCNAGVRGPFLVIAS